MIEPSPVQRPVRLAVSRFESRANVRQREGREQRHVIKAGGVGGARLREDVSHADDSPSRRYPRALMSDTGRLDQPAGIGGTFDPKRVNFFCRSCRRFVQTPPGTSSMRECPTPGCTEQFGFGIYWKTPRPVRGSGRR